MKSEVTPEEIERYRRDGFIMFDGFLTPAELEEWREALAEAFEIRKNAVLPGQIERAPDNYVEKIFQQRLNLWMDCPKMSKIMLEGTLGRLAATLAGVDAMRIWHDQALVKPAWGRPTDWHMDNPYWSFASPDAISVWVALDDATPDNGCLYFVPGSHKVDPRGNPDIGKGMDALFVTYPEFADKTAVRAEMKAGSASFHNGRTFHGAQANMTPRPRRAMTCAYMPDGSVYNGQANVLPPAYAETLKIGDPISDDRFVPLVGAGAPASA